MTVDPGQGRHPSCISTCYSAVAQAPVYSNMVQLIPPSAGVACRSWGALSASRYAHMQLQNSRKAGTPRMSLYPHLQLHSSEHIQHMKSPVVAPGKGLELLAILCTLHGPKRSSCYAWVVSVDLSSGLGQILGCNTVCVQYSLILPDIIDRLLYLVRNGVVAYTVSYV